MKCFTEKRVKQRLQVMKQFFQESLNVPSGIIARFSRLSGLALLLVLGVSIALFNPWSSYPGRSQSTPSEIRGVWLTNIDSDVLFSQQKTTKAIDTLAELNFNTVYPTVWNWGYTLYPSQVAKQVTGTSIDPEEGLQERDVLQEIVTQAHAKGMTVIPWFEFGFMAPADSKLAERNPAWLTQRRDRTTVWLEGNVHERVWLNPLRPDVQEFITDLILEIVSNYDVDGIQVDDHFGFPSDFGYDQFTVQLYQKEHSGKVPPANPKDSEWISWRADKITAYMEQLYRKIKEHNPKLIVSVSPNPQDFSLKSYLLDWQRWEHLGLVEELILQVYRRNIQDFRREIAQPEVQQAKQHIPVGIGILSGLKGRPVGMEQITSQVEAVRSQKFAGGSFFFYESLWNMGAESPSQRQSAWRDLLGTLAKRP